MSAKNNTNQSVINLYTAYDYFWAFSVIRNSDLSSDQRPPWEKIPENWKNGIIILLDMAAAHRDKRSEDPVKSNEWRLWCRQNKSASDQFRLDLFVGTTQVLKNDVFAFFSPLTMAVSAMLPHAILIAAEESCQIIDDGVDHFVNSILMQTTQNASKIMTAMSRQNNITFDGRSVKSWINQIPYINQRDLKSFETALYGKNALQVWLSADRESRRDGLISAISSGHTAWIERIGKQLVAADPSLCENKANEISIHSAITSHGVKRDRLKKSEALKCESMIWLWMKTLPVKWNLMKANTLTELDNTAFLELACFRDISNIPEDVKNIWATLHVLKKANGKCVSSSIPHINQRIQNLLHDLEYRNLKNSSTSIKSEKHNTRKSI